MPETRGTATTHIRHTGPHGPARVSEISVSAICDSIGSEVSDDGFEDTDDPAFTDLSADLSTDLFTPWLNCDSPLYDRERHAQQIDAYANEQLKFARRTASRLLAIVRDVREEGRASRAALSLRDECQRLCHEAHQLRKTARRLRALTTVANPDLCLPAK